MSPQDRAREINKPLTLPSASALNTHENARKTGLFDSESDSKRIHSSVENLIESLGKTRLAKAQNETGGNPIWRLPPVSFFAIHLRPIGRP